ncbi:MULTISPECIES: hypothetical protein [unclassified Streptomyces]|uniref:hypothetical protein n=1 Tax=unclassified Streptomyces TaxID=2593676 RepID=UPI0004CB92C9|nr:hypothetical protein [Streptomyces sp. NRRL F-5630]
MSGVSRTSRAATEARPGTTTAYGDVTPLRSREGAAAARSRTSPAHRAPARPADPSPKEARP